MNDDDGHDWALVLAAGHGNRLRSLTTTASGVAVPKQFCSLRGGGTLLDEALSRAAVVAPPARTCIVVADQHRAWWSAPPSSVATHTVIVQPDNRGTAHGILLPLLHIAARDPDARVVLLPADHHVRDEPTMACAIREAARCAVRSPASVFLLGVKPDHPDSELGYILPAPMHDGRPAAVGCFVEKPSVVEARALIARGALWNIFIVAATVRALLGLFAPRFSNTLAAMREALAGEPGDDRRFARLGRLYSDLPTLDFSRDVLEGRESCLRVLAVPACGWTDLGTPTRVAETLRRLPWMTTQADDPAGSVVNLAFQQARLLEATLAPPRARHGSTR